MESQNKTNKKQKDKSEKEYRRTYPKDYAGISITEETHQRLTRLRDMYNEATYDVVLNKLLDLEEQFVNPSIPAQIFEFEYVIREGTKLFRVIYADTITIEFYNYNSLQFEDTIDAWFTGVKIEPDEIGLFVKAMSNEETMKELYERGDYYFNVDHIVVKKLGVVH